MEELTIKINERFSDNFGEPLSYVLNLLIQINEANPSEINFDFSACKFINPFVIGGIVAISNALKIAGKRVNFIIDKSNLSVSSYFDTIHFPEGFAFDNLTSAEMNERLEEYHSKTFIPLVLFPTTINNEGSALRENVLSAINTILSKQLKLTGNLLEAIYYLVDELTNNVADHSESQNGILFAQFYTTKNYMDVCIADFGKGIKQTYIDSGKADPVSDEQAIGFAITGKSTKNQSISRGFGISTSRRMLTEGLKGKFFLCSGDAMFYQNSEKQEIIALPPNAYFKGCMVALRIPILPNNQFDFYKYTR
jgi:anti-sigma regulatory factor (Ser/Thr protein kinase)